MTLIAEIVGDPPHGDRPLAPESGAVPPRLHSEAVRSRGIIAAGFALDRNRTMLRDSFQSGCLRLRAPRRHGDAGLEAVLINTSGGLAEGDRLQQQFSWAAAAAATVTSQAAEKVYRAQSSGAVIETRIEAGNHSKAEWLPQETILFNGARLARDVQVRLAGTSSFLAVEAVVFGRTAMAEQVERGMLSDRWRIWREGRLIYADSLLLDGSVSALMRRSAIAAGAAAIATLIHVSARAAELLAMARDCLHALAGRAAASTWNGILVVRFLAREGSQLRSDIIALLAVLRGGRPLPRVWSC